MDALLADLSLPLTVAGVGAALAGAAWLGGRLRRSSDAGHQAEIGSVVAGALGLLALLTAFTFSVALDGYATRRDLVVSEAASIETSWLRADLVAPAARAPLRAMLADYVRSRRQFYDAGSDARRLAAANADADRRQRAIWAVIVAAGADRDRALFARDLAAAFTDVVAVSTRREAAARARIPTTVIVTVLATAGLSCLVLGYAIAASPRRHRAMSASLFVVLALAVGLILDLDRPRRGAIRVSQQPLADLAARMALDDARPPPPAAAAAPRR